MLKILRKKGVAKRICWSIVIIIIIAFGFAGKAYLLSGRKHTNYAGTIFGKKIAFNDYAKAYHAVNIQEMLKYGDNFDKIKPFLNLEAAAWDRLILLHEANIAKINVSDEEVIDEIKKYPFFQRNGKFDNDLYKRILLRYFRIKPREFEESIRQTLMMRKLYEQKTAGTSISEQEIFNTYKRRNEKVQVNYVLIPTKAFLNKATFNEKKAHEYFKNHKNEFKVPVMVDVKYITLDFPTKDKDNNKQDNNNNNTTASKQDKNKDKEIEKIKTKAQQIYKQLTLSPSLKEVAQKNGIKMHTTGYFSMEKPNLKPGWSYKILTQVFQMQPGDIMEPFKTSKGLCIIQLRARKEAHIPTYQEAKEQIRKAVLKQEAKKIAKQAGEQYLKTIKEELSKTKLKDFAKIVKNLGLEIHQTPIFTRGQYLPTVGISHNFQTAAFKLTPENPLSGLIDTPKGFCILYLEKYIPVDKKQYTKDRNSLSKILLDQRKNEIFNNYMKAIREKANLKDNIAEIQKNKTNNSQSNENP